MRKPITLLLVVLLCCCKKDKERLNENPDSSITQILSLDDAQAVLDHTIMNLTPAGGELSADNFYLSPETNGMKPVPVEMNTYLWRADMYEGQGNINDWNKPYQQVLQSNTALAALDIISDSSDVIKRNSIKGAALFFRAHAHAQIALLFAPLPASAPDGPWGIPLRLSTDASVPSTRATVADTYTQILNDLSKASQLLPAAIDSKRKNRPSKAAAYGLMARVYLFMGDYPKAQEYADSCLQYNETLTDYKTLLPVTTGNPFISNNNELIFSTTLLNTTLFESNAWYIDTVLFNSYDKNDLRKELFFKTDSATGLLVQQYNYAPNKLLFSGIATDEIYLIRAEAKAKNGDTRGAMVDLNKLLKNRWRTDSLFIPRRAASPEDAVQQIRAERRRELLWRGLRWIDIRRYNAEGSGAPLTRITKNEVIHLAPNDPKFILPIPPDVIQLSGMPQNERK
jgi:tetratricopeptide (TPR) repeat protein